MIQFGPRNEHIKQHQLEWSSKRGREREREIERREWKGETDIQHWSHLLQSNIVVFYCWCFFRAKVNLINTSHVKIHSYVIILATAVLVRLYHAFKVPFNQFSRRLFIILFSKFAYILCHNTTSILHTILLYMTSTNTHPILVVDLSNIFLSFVFVRISSFYFYKINLYTTSSMNMLVCISWEIKTGISVKNNFIIWFWFKMTTIKNISTHTHTPCSWR